MSSVAATPTARGATPWATFLVAVIVAGLLQFAGMVFSLLALPATVRGLTDEFDGSVETATSATRIVLLTVLPYLVMAVLILLVAVIMLVRLTRSGRPVRWGMALLVGSLASIPVGLAISLAQWPIARAVSGIGT